MKKVRISARNSWWGSGMLAIMALAVPALAVVFAAYSLGDLSLQNGWDGGIVGQGFTNNNANSDVVTNAIAFTGTQSWRYSGSYGSPGSGTPFTPYVATVGAPNAATAFGAGLNSPVTPSGDQSIISFAFKAVAPGDGSQFNVYEGNRDLPDPPRTGPNLYIQATSATDVTLHRFHLSSTDSCANQDFPDVTLATVAAGSWHTVKVTTTYPNVTPANFSTYGTTTYIIDEGTGGQITVTDSDAVWVHQFNFCNGGPYSPGTAIKWSNSNNDYPTHQGFYIDDVSMKVRNTGTGSTVASFATSFEAAPLTQATLTVNATSPATFGSTQTLTTSGGSGDGAVSYSVGASTACTVAGDQLTITNASGSCSVTATKAADAVYSQATSSPATVVVQAPDMTITKSHLGNFQQGDIGDTYTITVTNSGTAPTSGTVTVSDTLPAGLTPTGPNGAVNGWNCSIAGQTLTCTRSDVLPSGSYPAIMLTVNVANNAGPNLTNTATVSGGGEGNTANDSASDSTTVTQLADVRITKSVITPQPYAAGSSVAYTITVLNMGASAASNVVVSDTLPAGSSFVSSTPSQGSCSGTSTVTCNLGGLVNGGSATITLVLTTPSTPGVVSNTATVTSSTADPNSANNSSTATITTIPASQVPAISQWALLALVGILAVLGAMKIRS